MDNTADYPKSQSQLEKQLGLTAASLNSAITKGWLNKKSVEVYRDPLSGFDDGEHKTAVTLNGEQQSALNQITQAIEQYQAETFLLEGYLRNTSRYQSTRLYSSPCFSRYALSGVCSARSIIQSRLSMSTMPIPRISSKHPIKYTL